MSDPSDNPPQDEGLITVAEIVARCPQARGVAIVGACDASMPLRFRALLPDTRILAIEALPENYVRWLAPHKEFESICVAIGGTSGTKFFHVQNRNGIHGLHDRGFLQERRVIACACLDDVLSRANFGMGDKATQWDIIVIDAEGAGPDVVDGGTCFIEKAKVVAIELEDHEFFKGQRLGEHARIGLRFAGLRRVLDRSVEIESGRLQHEELWVR